MRRSLRRDLIPRPLTTESPIVSNRGGGARAIVMIAALALTSCPHQMEVHRQAAASTESGSNRGSERATPIDVGRTDVAPRPEPSKEVAPVEYESRPGESSSASDVVASLDAADPPGAASLDAADPPSADDPPSPSDAANPETRLVYSIGRETWIFAEPRFAAKQLGYLRFGAEVQRTTEAVRGRGCSGGWYGVKPSGYVCVNGRTATIDAKHPLVQGRIERPDRMAALPFAYTLARRGIPRFFGFAPSDPQRSTRAFSKRLPSQLGQLRTAAVPDWLRRPRQIFGYQRSEDRALLGEGLAGGGIALVGFYSDLGTLYGITPDLELVMTDELDAVRPSAFAGKIFAEGETLPLAFAITNGVWVHQGEPRDGSLRPLRRATRREVFALSGERVQVDGQQWWRTKDGNWLRGSGLRVIAPRTDWPEWARSEQIWVDVSINQQTLVAYEGKRAAYATLVSTGIDGLMDPTSSKSTKTGVFHIVSKHLTATMNGDEPDNAYEMREVPWVQYFSEGYALHGAYWHDAFGQPRSHGCINLSPIDARWLFHFTHPGLPKDWHGTIPSEPSATVYVHP